MDEEPSGAHIATTGQFSWTPSDTQVGDYTFNVTATDGTVTVRKAVSVTVIVSNTAPVLDDIGSKSANEGSTLSFVVNAADTNRDDTLSYSMSGAPPGAVLNQTSGTFSWIPTEAQGPGTYDITFAVHDGRGGQDEEAIIVTIHEINVPPTLVLPTDMPSGVDEGSKVSFTATATDPDLPANSLTFGLSSEPPGAHITDDGRFSWTPTEQQGPDTHTFNVTVNDGAGGTASRQVAIIVHETDEERAGPQTIITPPTNQTGSVNDNPANQISTANPPPVLDEIGARTIKEGSSLSFTIKTTDDDDDMAYTLTYSMSGEPDGAVLDTASGAFSWTPTEAQGPGTYDITFGVSDGQGGSNSEDVTITVHEANQIPQFESRVAEGYHCNVAINSTINLNFAITNPDLPAQTLSITDSSAGDIDYSATVTGGMLKFSVAVVETDGQQFPYDHKLLFYIEVTDGHNPPGLDNVLIYVYLPAANEPDWPSC